MTVHVLCLAGATGTGKTEAALHLARRFNGAVVNFDSRQVYRDIPLITAQPSPEEQAVCPHHLYGFLASHIPVRAGSFVEMVQGVVSDLAGEGRLPILVGGTGLYLQTLLEGLAPIPLIDPQVRERIEEECASLGSCVLYQRLLRNDPVYAAKIHPNDRQRISRALEVFEGTGRPLSWWHDQPGEKKMDIQALQLGIRVDLHDLEPRLNQRIHAMLAGGAVEEMRAAYALCPHRMAPAFTGIGCPELLGHLLDQVPLEETTAVWLHNTRAYAKRQITWFKRNKHMYWFPPGACEEMDTRVEEWRHDL
jgi:tRNA dimethylallyltransferase